MKNILIIGSGIEPNENANGICTEQLIRELRSRDKNVFYIDWLLNNQQSYTRRDGTVIYGPQLPPTEVNDNQTDKSAIRSDTHKRIDEYLRALYLRLIYPFESIRKTKLMCSTAYEVCCKFDIDMVISVYQPFITLYAGYCVKKKYKNIVFIPYYLDLISNPYIGKRFLPIIYQRKKLDCWENKINNIANSAIYMIHSLIFHTDYHSDRTWYHRIKYLDIPLYSPKPRLVRPLPEKPDFIELVFCGYIGDHRNIEFFLNVFRELPTNIRMTFVGNSTIKQKSVIDLFMKQMPDRIRYMGYVPNADIHLILEKSDCLVNFGVKSSTAISAKIFEYMSYCKPIIMTYSVADEPSIVPLKKYPCSLIVDENESNYAEIASDVEHFLICTKGTIINPAKLEKEFILNMPSSFADYIENVI